MIYSTTPGTLKISAVENKLNGTIAVSVRDNGIGMTRESAQLGKLFQPPYTIEARGIGLGRVVKNLMQANGVRVEVKSEQGKGITFAIIWPVEPVSIRRS